MAFYLRRSVINKRAIDILVGFISKYLLRNRLYQNTQISDRFSFEEVGIPCVIVKGVSNTQKRTSFDDFISDHKSRVQLVPVSADSTLFGNNVQQVNLPNSIAYEPRWPWDNSIGISSGTDINATVFTSGIVTNTGTNTGIIITVPGPNIFEPTSISYADEITAVNIPSVITGTNSYNMAIAISSTQDQMYLVVSGTDMVSGVTIPVDINQIILDGSGVAAGLSGTRIYLNDTLFAGDQYILNTNPTPIPTYAVYGGIYNTNMTFECYAKTTLEAEELGDLVESILVERKFELYDREGISILQQGQGGGAERDYVNEYIFQSTVTMEMMKEWHEYRSIQTITSISGIVIPTGFYSGTVNSSNITQIFAGIPVELVSIVSGITYYLPDGINGSGQFINSSTRPYPEFSGINYTGVIPASAWSGNAASGTYWPNNSSL